MKKSLALALLVTGAILQSPLAAQKANAPAAPMTPSQPFVRDPKIPIDEEYTKKIKEYTTEPFFASLEGLRIVDQCQARRKKTMHPSPTV